MSQIKLRIRSSDGKVWCGTVEDIIMRHCAPFVIEYPACKKELWTGKKDKNGVDIYEGDIVVGEEYPFFDDGKRNYVGVIEWDEGCFYYVLQCVNPNKRGISSGIGEQLEDGEDFDVIGNTTDNPELLEAI